VSNAGRGLSPRPATPMSDGLWSKAPGPIAIQPRGADLCNCDSNNHPPSSRTSAGRPRSGSVHAPDDSSPEGNLPTWSLWPLRGSWRASGGPWPERCRQHPTTTNESGFHPPLRRFPPCIGRGAAPMWCTPRQREEVDRGYSHLDGGRPPTEASQVVATPRLAAGSTVGSSGLRLCRCPKDKSIIMT
jgi:hypothetical protein